MRWMMAAVVSSGLVLVLAGPATACTNPARQGGSDLATVAHPNDAAAYAYVGAHPSSGRVYAGWNTPSPGKHYEAGRSSSGDLYVEGSNNLGGAHVGTDRQCSDL